jgi:hypothetical protein
MRFLRSKRSGKRTIPQDVTLRDSEPIEQQTNVAQSSSRLLNLPSEIRLQVLRSIFSHHMIHFFIARTDEGAQFGWPQGRVKPTKPRIQSQWCSPRCSHRFNDTHHEDDIPGGGGHDVELAPSQALDALLSCRQIYHEAVDLLYAENVFDFVDLLTFGDFAAQFQPALGRIRRLQARHKVPALGHYARFDPPAGLRAAVKVSWDAPAMLLHFASAVMPQLREMRLLFERCWMTSEYEAEYSRRHAEWVRYITQLAKCPGVGQPRDVRALGMPWNPQLQALDG